MIAVLISTYLCMFIVILFSKDFVENREYSMEFEKNSVQQLSIYHTYHIPTYLLNFNHY